MGVTWTVEVLDQDGTTSDLDLDNPDNEISVAVPNTVPVAKFILEAPSAPQIMRQQPMQMMQEHMFL